MPAAGGREGAEPSQTSMGRGSRSPLEPEPWGSWERRWVGRVMGKSWRRSEGRTVSGGPEQLGLLPGEEGAQQNPLR